MDSGLVGGREGQRDGSSSTIREIPVAGPVPRFELTDWRERFGVVAGITSRGEDQGRGFDLGLWSLEPVGEVMNRWLAFRRAMPEFLTVVLGNQVHGVEIEQAPAAQGWVQVQGVDGWITTTPGVLLTVTVADCIPVYLVAPGRGLALLHAGWRGTAGGILHRGVKRLSEVTGVSPADLVMHCGIGICGSCYEVGSEVLQGCGIPVEGEGPWQLDLRDYLAGQAKGLGLAEVTMSPWCSAHDRPTFYSHRASRGIDGRMVAYLGWVNAASA